MVAVRCRCNANWCYLCGALWKTCTCPQYRGERRETLLAHEEEEDLFDPALELYRGTARMRPEVRRGMVLGPIPPAPIGPPPRAPRLHVFRPHLARITARMAALFARRICSHNDWRRNYRLHECHSCGTRTRGVRQCRWCGLQACEWCRRMRG